MKKRIISLLLTVTLMFGVISMTAVDASAASSMKASERLITVLKQFEGFIAKPVWDYSQYSVGYGSAVKEDSEEFERYMEEGITEEEADALLRKYVAIGENAINNLIDTYGLTLSQQQFDALIDFCYNCGTSWTKQEGSFRASIISGATGTKFLNAIVSWCKAGGKIETGLIKRRLAEANMYLNDVYDVTPPSSYCYVLYNARGGYCALAIQAFQAGEVITELPATSKTGMNFIGWFTASSGGTKVTQLDSSLSGKTIYAQWETPEGTPEPAPEEVPVNYQRVVRVSTSLNVREEATTSSGVVKVLYNDDVVTVVAELELDGMLWGKLEGGGWIALKYTEAYTGEEKPAEPEEPAEPEDPETPEEPEPPQGPETPAEPEQPATEIKVTVTGSVVNVRSGAGTSNGVTSAVYRGQTVTLVEVTDAGGAKWGKLSTGGWICLTYTDYKAESTGGTEQPSEPQQPSGETTVKVTNGPINVRSGAGTGNKVISSVYNGQSLTITSVTNVDGRPWGQISGSGWICLSYTDYQAGGNGSSGGETQTPTTPSGTTATVTGSVVNVRTGPGTSNGISSAVYRGTAVTIVETTTVNGAAWGKLSTGGWIALQYTDYSGISNGGGTQTPTTPSKPTGGTMTGTVKASSLNVRSKAGMDGAIVGGLSNGATVEILEQTTVDGVTWGRISSGWISMSYVATQGGSGSTGGTSSSGSTYTVTGTVVNVRSGAGLNNGVVSTVTKGTSVTIVETASADGMTWGKLSSGGWISMSYVA